MKKSRTANLTHILETIYNFDSIVNHIHRVKLEARKANLTRQSDLGGDVELYSYIKICNAYHEIEILQKLAARNQLLQDIFYGMKPMLRIINEYKTGIQHMRNRGLAHFNRDKKGNFSPYWDSFTLHELPQEPGELDLIHSCLDILRVVLIDHFEKDLRPFYEKIRLEMDTRMAEWKAGLTARAEKDLLGIKREINQRLAEKGLISANEDYLESLRLRGQVLQK